MFSLQGKLEVVRLRMVSSVLSTFDHSLHHDVLKAETQSKLYDQVVQCISTHTSYSAGAVQLRNPTVLVECGMESASCILEHISALLLVPGSRTSSQVVEI